MMMSRLLLVVFVGLVELVAGFQQPSVNSIQRTRPLRRQGVMTSLLENEGLMTLASNTADLPDPRIPVIALAFLAVAFGVTQIGIIGVVQEEDKLGAEPGRKARDQMARRRGYFRKK